MRVLARRSNRAKKFAFKNALSVLLLAAVLGQTGMPVLAKEMPLRGQVGINRMSPPQSGVRLLEDIFQRVRSAPQVALAKNLKLQVAAQNDMQQGLQIRPPKPSPKTVVSQAPTLALLPPSLAPRPILQDKASSTTSSEQNQFAESLSSAFGGSGGPGGGGGGPTATRSEPAAAVPESWLGSRQYPVAANERKGAGAPQGMWEARQQEESESNIIVQSGSGSRNAGAYAKPRKQVQPPDLATAVGRLYGATKAADEMQKIASGAQPYSNRQRADNSPAETTAYKQDLRRGKAEMKVSSDAGAADGDTSSGASFGIGYAAGPAAPPLPVERRAAPKRNESAAVGKKVAAKEKSRASIGKDAPSDNEEGDEGYTLQDRKLAWSPNIALRAPSVATGIPQANIRLGMSESNASSAIKILGSMKREKVDKWTVWSWDRTPSRIQTALQLYMRNGLLDAMRVFDPTLVAPDFGVTMGDNLARVKEKFGEPAFILQEPGPGAGQNYIYPISQVGFQLARPAPNQEPRVVSVLIFNVK